MILRVVAGQGTTLAFICNARHGQQLLQHEQSKARRHRLRHREDMIVPVV